MVEKTIVERMIELGYVPDKYLNWEIGQKMEKWYTKRHNALPKKDLRQKTSGPGSHCFAVYEHHEDMLHLDDLIHDIAGEKIVSSLFE